MKWLSAFPFEEEPLYPPATYLKPLRTGPRGFKIGNTTFVVVDVEPQLSWPLEAVKRLRKLIMTIKN